jgi:hypothetical protein
LKKDEVNQVIIGTDITDGNGVVAFLVLPLDVINRSQNPVSDAHVVLRYQHMLERRPLEPVLALLNSDYTARLPHNLRSDEKFDYVDYAVPPLAADAHQTIYEPFRAHATKLDVDASVVARDGVNILIPRISTVYAFGFDLTLTYEGRAPDSFPLEIEIRKTTSERDLQLLAADELIPDEIAKRRREEGLVSYISHVILPHDEVHVSIVFEPLVLEHVGKPADDKAVALPGGDVSTGSIAFDPHSLSMIFSDGRR